MPVIGALKRCAARLRAQDGFTMLLALGILLVVMLLSAAVFTAARGDTQLTRDDLNGKRAYAAAQAGIQAYLYAINTHASNSTWWQTCANDAQAITAVPGSSTGAMYSYTPVTTCSPSNPIGSLIDPGTGTLRLKFTGYAGQGCTTGAATCATRTVVAQLRTLSPLSYLWYTVHETVDTALGDSTCSRFYHDNPGPDSSCEINWVTNDHVTGSMYTQDQFLIYPGAAPTFGGSSTDTIASQAAVTSVCVASNCYGTKFNGIQAPHTSEIVPLPTDNSNLATDAANHGVVFNGTTTLVVNGTTARGYTCTTATTCTPVSVDLTQTPILYGASTSGCGTPTYTPSNVSYPAIMSGTYQPSKLPSPLTGTQLYYGTCGDIYIAGTYSVPITVAADDNVILTGSLLNSTDANGATNPTGSATAGLVANYYVRVMHVQQSQSNCPSTPNVTIDAAILTLKHSFFVDNYDCGNAQGTLTVHGAIAQYFRGIVGTVGSTGYLKNYVYDSRLAIILPPYLFDLQNTAWKVFRETLCSQGVAGAQTDSCSYTGP